MSNLVTLFFLQVAKAWHGHVTTCVHQRVCPLAKLLGADRVISLPHDPEKAESRHVLHERLRDTLEKKFRHDLKCKQQFIYTYFKM